MDDGDLDTGGLNMLPRIGAGATRTDANPLTPAFPPLDDTAAAAALRHARDAQARLAEGEAELARLPSRDKLSIVKRAIVRKIMGSIKQKDSV